ncbi:MAG: uracil-DNA glycosylase family protein, partial [Marinomonas sp.]
VATDWLAEAEAAKPAKAALAKRATKPEPEPEKKPEILRILPQAGAPNNLDAFHAWWMEDPALDAIGPRGRVAARGEVGAELMVLVPDPAGDDGAQLLSGAQGQLLEKILKASAIEPSDVYYASALPRHTPMADGADLAAKGYAEVLHLHIALARPKRILAFGSHILPLLQHGAAEELQKEAGSLQQINHDNRTTPLFVAQSLGGLMGSPSLKARFWRHWVKIRNGWFDEQ